MFSKVDERRRVSSIKNHPRFLLNITGLGILKLYLKFTEARRSRFSMWQN